MKRLCNQAKMKIVIGMITAGIVCSVPVTGADSTTFAQESGIRGSMAVSVTRVRANNQKMVQAINVMDHNIDPVIGVKKCEKCGQKSVRMKKKKCAK